MTGVQTCALPISVVFPDAVSHGYGTHSGDITLALNKLVVDISVPVRDPLAVVVLDTAWILIGGLPDIACSEGLFETCLAS